LAPDEPTRSGRDKCDWFGGPYRRSCGLRRTLETFHTWSDGNRALAVGLASRLGLLLSPKKCPLGECRPSGRGRCLSSSSHRIVTGRPCQQSIRHPRRRRNYCRNNTTMYCSITLEPPVACMLSDRYELARCQCCRWLGPHIICIGPPASTLPSAPNLCSVLPRVRTLYYPSSP
jgi:hypothetical protein